MTSDRKSEANRQNARKSTGPKTPEGKAAVRLNALKHGLLSKEILLPGEDEDELDELVQRVRDELRPVGELESLLVDRIVGAYWRLRRLGRVEAGIFVWEHKEESAERAEREAHSYVLELPDPYAPKNTSIVDEGRYGEALERAWRLRSEQEKDEAATLGRTFARDADRANAFSKLSRYETAIERSLYRALHELERRQATRLGTGAAPPQVLDVDVSGIQDLPEEVDR